jgi:hypothetical protein
MLPLYSQLSLRLIAEGIESDLVATYLTLEGAKILQVRGFGGNTSSSGYTRIQLEDDGILAVYYNQVFGGWKKIYWFKYGNLALYTGTQNVHTGGGWSGGGFGAKGVVEGLVAATLLNAVTTKNREYTLLTVVSTDLATGAQKSVSFGFQNTDEATLRTKLARAVPTWMEPVVTRIEEILRNCTDKNEAAQWFAIVTSCQKNAILTDEQADRLFVVIKTIVPEAFLKPVAQIEPASRVEQLKTLSELRNSNALREEEFQAEKLRVLSA